MSEPTQRWRPQEGTAAYPVERAPASTPAPLDPLALTMVSDRVPVATRGPIVAPVVFPGYEILGELGRGGMGVVYKARQRSLNRLVALKVILGGPLASDEDKARFRIEAEAAARLHHPNIVQVYDVGEHAGFSYMALELIEGQTLRQWQNGQPVEPRHAARLISALARAIHHAHEQGIVHRDMKPANVLLAPVTTAHPDLGAGSAAMPTATSAIVARSMSGFGASHAPLAFTPKVTDFGLAKALENGQDLTVTGVACGTPNYMAPEQVRGLALSPAVDVYGLGAVLYELLAGRPPFVGTDAPALMNLILKTEPPGVRKFAPAVPHDLAVIVAKCLEKDPARRYPSAREAADDLDRFLAGKPITARPIGTPERAVRWVKRNPIPAAFLFLSTIGCAVTGTLALALARSGSEQRAARDSADVAREEADRQRFAAESASAKLAAALQDVSAQKQTAEREKQAAEAASARAKGEEARATKQQQAAEDARTRAEDNLRVARDVICRSMRELSRHPRFEDDDFRNTRTIFLDQVRKFRDTVAEHAPETREWLDDLSDVSHFLGFLEYVNKNHDRAAEEYKTAARAAGRWSALEPTSTEPRTRQSYSLVNAGNALVNARRYDDAAQTYQDAARLIDGVLADVPTNEAVHHQANEIYGQLANVYRIDNRLADWEDVARQRVALARGRMLAVGVTPDTLRLLATMYDELAKPLVRREKWDEVDRAMAGAVAARDRARTAAPSDPKLTIEYGTALLARSAHLRARGNAFRANELQARAVGAFDSNRGAPTDPQAVEMATAYTKLADTLRTSRQLAEAEARYNKALDLVGGVLHRTPASRPARDAWASATTGRAHVYNGTGRHREAATEWARLAVEDPDTRFRNRHELYTLQSHLYARDWKPAVAGAELQMKRELPGWLWLDLARVWCIAAQQAGDEADLEPAERLAQSEAAVNKAVACLEKARAAGEFKNSIRLNWFKSNREFDAIRGKFDPLKR